MFYILKEKLDIVASSIPEMYPSDANIERNQLIETNRDVTNQEKLSLANFDVDLIL